VLARHASVIAIVVVNDVGGGGACNTGVCTCVGRRFLEGRNEVVPFLEKGRIDCISALDLGGVAVVVVDIVEDGVGIVVDRGVVGCCGRHVGRGLGRIIA